MKNLFLILIIFFNISCAKSQSNEIDKTKIQQDLNDIIQNIESQYAYLEDKKVDILCIKEKYSKKIDDIKTKSEVILLFEYLLNEFYDSHISLSTNIRESYRLSAPIYVEIEREKVIIKNVWKTQIKNLETNILGAEVLKFNEVNFNNKIDNFPTFCNDKTVLEVRNWIANKIISGKYSEPRILTLKLKTGENIKFDLDALKYKNEQSLLTIKTEKNIGVIRINNSLGNNQLIREFDTSLDSLSKTKGLIIDLRNTNNGGNTYVAKGIMSRFIDKEMPYQKHLYIQEFDNQPKIIRSWFELVSPRGKQYTKPVIILVGKWTGSMGEGIAVGFDGMKRATIVGTEMKRLAGSDFDYKFNNQNFGYKLIWQRLYHIDGTPREKYIPRNYVRQNSIEKDESLEKGIALIDKMTE